MADVFETDACTACLLRLTERYSFAPLLWLLPFRCLFVTCGMHRRPPHAMRNIDNYITYLLYLAGLDFAIDFFCGATRLFLHAPEHAISRGNRQMVLRGYVDGQGLMPTESPLFCLKKARRGKGKVLAGC